MNEYQYNLNVHRTSPVIHAKPFSIFKSKSKTKSTFNNYLLCSPSNELKYSNPSMYFRTFTQCNFSSSKKESEINIHNNKPNYLMSHVNSLSTSVPSLLSKPNNRMSFSGSEPKYSFLKHNINKYKYLNNENIDYILKTPEITEHTNNYPLSNVRSRNIKPTKYNNIQTKSKTNISNLYSKNNLSKVLAVNLKKEDAHNFPQRKHMKKSSITARLFLKVQTECDYDILEEHLTEMNLPEDKYKRFRLLLTKQNQKIQKLRNDIQKAARSNTQNIKLYVTKLLMSQIRQNYHKKKTFQLTSIKYK